MNILLKSLLLVFVSNICAKVPRPRGVAISKSSLYVTGSVFKCLDGSAKIPLDQINDDYCDCADGSDEPGTSACPNGSFHCTNAGHKPMNIPSSRVNDGICDCCDATDEYDRKVQCGNTCKERGKAAREEAERLRKAVEEGYEVYKEYCDQGSTAKSENQGKLVQLQQKKDALEANKKEFEDIKNAAELPEKEAKDTHQKAWDEEKAKRDSDKDIKSMEAAFAQLDTNKDSLVSVEEMKVHTEFDIDINGEVSEEEAKDLNAKKGKLRTVPTDEIRQTNEGIPYRFKTRKIERKQEEEKLKLIADVRSAIEYLEDKDQITIQDFGTEVWPNIKSIYKKPEAEAGGEQHENTQQETTEQTTVKPESQPDEDDYDYDHDDEDDYDEDEKEEAEETKSEETSDEMPEYDENTKLLIAAADKARADFNEADSQFKQVEQELNDVNHLLSLDLGESHEYFTLKDQCYEYTDREYTYKFCPFDKATQRSKNGGAETMLGKWGRWDGPENNKYSIMLMDQGQSCWNGPNRSVKVYFKCGISNEVTSASEPNRCEYQFDFLTPAACNEDVRQQTQLPKDPDHDEL